MKSLRIFASIVLLCVPAATAQRRHDPLTTLEADQLREAAQEPNRRLPLFIKFARARMDEIDKLRADTKPDPDRGLKLRDMIEDFGNLIDELDDNIDDYASRSQDMRKPLKEVIDSSTEFQTRLKTLQDGAAKDPRAAAESREYKFVLENTLDAVNSVLDNAKKTLADQIANKGELKKGK